MTTPPADRRERRGGKRSLWLFPCAGPRTDRSAIAPHRGSRTVRNQHLRTQGAEHPLNEPRQLGGEPRKRNSAQTDAGQRGSSIVIQHSAVRDGSQCDAQRRLAVCLAVMRKAVEKRIGCAVCSLLLSAPESRDR